MVFEVVGVVHIDDEATTRSQFVVNLAQKIYVCLLVKVTQALPHIDYGIKLACQFANLAHITDQVSDLLVRLCSPVPGFGYDTFISIKTCDLVAKLSQLESMTAIAATQIEYAPIAREREL